MGVIRMFKRLYLKTKKGDGKESEIEKQRAKNEFNKRNIVLGNGIVEFFTVECSQCNSKFKDFDFVYLKKMNKYYPCCPYCKADITQHTFYPLDKLNKRM